MQSFENLIPHDAIINYIKIDRTNPGKVDSIVFELNTADKIKFELIFMEVYAINFNMNLGIIADESIREAYVETENSELEKIRNKWNVIGVDLTALECYVINTNSTNSLFRIYAKEFPRLVSLASASM